MSGRGYRHELKYYINRGDYLLLSNRLSRCMDRDRFADERGEYFIRSLYFDDMDDTAFRQKLDGVDVRDKYRIRIYNGKDDNIKLERKHKEGQYILKESLSLSRPECDALIAGQPGFLLERREPFAKQMFAAFRCKPLRPRVLVDYAREAYVHPLEEVRITFDKNVRTGFRSTELFGSPPTYPVVEDYDMVLEVKFNRTLPLYLRSLIQIESHTRSAISKYCLCRKFEL